MTNTEKVIEYRRLHELFLEETRLGYLEFVNKYNKIPTQLSWVVSPEFGAYLKEYCYYEPEETHRITSTGTLYKTHGDLFVESTVIIKQIKDYTIILGVTLTIGEDLNYYIGRVVNAERPAGIAQKREASWSF